MSTTAPSTPLEPDVAVVTNLEADHLDIYGDLAGVREAFEIFLGALRPGGRAVICADDTGASALLTSVGGAGYTYGTSAGSQLRAVEVSAHGTGTRFRVIEEGKDQGEARIPLPGLHNLRNGLAAAAVARHLGVSWAAIHAGWASFEGVGRRFEVLGERAGVMVVDDYAHHPTEVAATLSLPRGMLSRVGAWSWRSSPTSTPAPAISPTSSGRRCPRRMRFGLRTSSRPAKLPSTGSTAS